MATGQFSLKMSTQTASFAFNVPCPITSQQRPDFTISRMDLSQFFHWQDSRESLIEMELQTLFLQ